MRPVAPAPPIATRPIALAPPIATIPVEFTPPMETMPIEFTPPIATTFTALTPPNVSRPGRFMQAMYQRNLSVTRPHRHSSESMSSWKGGAGGSIVHYYRDPRSCLRRPLRNLLRSSVICHSERSEESKAFHPSQCSFVGRGFRFLTSLRYVRNDSRPASSRDDTRSYSKVPLRRNGGRKA